MGAPAAADVDEDVDTAAATPLEVAAARAVEAAAAAFPAVFLFEKWKMLLMSCPMEIKCTMTRKDPRGEKSDFVKKKGKNE